MLTLPPLPASAMGPMIWACLNRLALALPFTANQFYAKTVALQLNHTNLTGLLYLQGYKLDEFVCGD